MFVVIFSVQTNHHLQLNSRGIWMKQVNTKLDQHAWQLDELTKSLDELPEVMIKRFKELPK